MRHQQLNRRDDFDVVDIAALWPNGADTAAAPLAEVEESVARPTAAAPDMPGAAGGLMIAVYGGLMGAFALTMAVGGPATFAIVISSFYVVMFFAVPAIFLGVERDGERRPSLGEFLESGIDTATGPISGRGALVQMLVVPALLTLAIAAMGIISLVTL